MHRDLVVCTHSMLFVRSKTGWSPLADDQTSRATWLRAMRAESREYSTYRHVQLRTVHARHPSYIGIVVRFFGDVHCATQS